MKVIEIWDTRNKQTWAEGREQGKFVDINRTAAVLQCSVFLGKLNGPRNGQKWTKIENKHWKQTNKQQINKMVRVLGAGVLGIQIGR